MRISDIEKLPLFIPKIASGIEGFGYKDFHDHYSVFVSDTIPLTTLMSDYLKKFRFSKKFTRHIYLEKYIKTSKLKYVRNFVKLRSFMLKSQAILTVDIKESNCYDMTLENIVYRNTFGPVQGLKKLGNSYIANPIIHNNNLDVFWILTNPNIDGRLEPETNEIDINHLTLMLNRVHKEHPLNIEKKNIKSVYILIPYDAEKDETSVDLNFLICKIKDKEHNDNINYARIHSVIEKMFLSAEKLSGKKLFTIHSSSIEKDTKIDPTYELDSENEIVNSKDVNEEEKINPLYLTEKKVNTKNKSQIQTNTTDLLKETYMKDLFNKDIVDMAESAVKNFNSSIEVKNISITNGDDGITDQDLYTITLYDNENKKSRNIDFYIPRLIEGKFFNIYGKKYILANQIYSNLVSKIKNDTVAFTSSHTKTLIYIQGKNDDKIGNYLSKNSGTKLQNINKYIVTENELVPSSLHSIFKFQPIFRYKNYIISYDLYLANFPDMDDNNDPILSKICIGLKESLYPTLDILKNKDSLYNYLKMIYVKYGADSFCFYNKFKDSINSKPFLIELKNELGKSEPSIKKMPIPGISTYARMNIGGKKVPVIMVMLLTFYNQDPNNRLKDFFKKYFGDSVHTEITDAPLNIDNVIDMALSDGYINIHIFDSLVGAELLFSVLRKLDLSKYSKNDMVENNDIFHILIAYFESSKYQPETAINSLSFNIKSILDPITINLIKESNYTYYISDKEYRPKDLIGILYYSVYLLNDRSYRVGSDFNSYRIRNMETIPAIIYKILSEKSFLAKKESDSKVKSRRKMIDAIDINKNDVIEIFRALTTFETYSDINLSSEIGLLSKVTYKGFAGMNNNRSISGELRQGSDTAIGFIDVCNNVDNANVGSNRFMPFNPNIKNVRGSGSIDKNLRNKVMSNTALTDFETTSLLSFDTYNEPFLAAHADSPRVSMASIQARHGITLDKYDDLPIKTGLEDSIKEIASDSFVIKSPNTEDMFKVFSINDTKKEIILKSKSNKLFNISYKDKIVNNSGGGFSILKEFEPCVKVGDSVGKNSAIALDKGSFKNGNYTNARMLMCTFLHYGETIEDGAIISASAAKELLFNYVTEKSILIREHHSIVKMINEIGKEVSVGEPLLVFTKGDKQDDLFNLFGNINKSIEEDELELNTYIKSKYNGTIVDIDIKYNTDETKVAGNKSLNKIFKEIPKNKIKYIKSNKINGKIVENAILVTYYILSKTPALTGSKSTNQSTKSVFKVMRDEDMPHTLDGKRVDYIMSTLSIITRMTINNFLNLYLNKCIYALRDKLKKELTKARILLKQVYSIVYKKDTSTHKTELDKISSYSDSELKKLIFEDKIYIYVKPFKEPTLEDIKEFAKLVGIELDEKLILPNMGNIVTERPVPVGYAPIKLLEQIVFKKTVTSHDIASTDSVTGQATSNTKTRMATSPELLNSFSHEGLSEVIFPELLLARSDDRDAAMDMQKQIANTGRFSTKKMSSSGINQVQKTLHYYLLGSGIDNDILTGQETSVDGQKIDTRKV